MPPSSIPLSTAALAHLSSLPSHTAANLRKDLTAKVRAFQGKSRSAVYVEEQRPPWWRVGQRVEWARDPVDHNKDQALTEVVVPPFKTDKWTVQVMQALLGLEFDYSSENGNGNKNENENKAETEAVHRDRDHNQSRCPSEELGWSVEADRRRDSHGQNLASSPRYNEDSSHDSSVPQPKPKQNDEVMQQQKQLKTRNKAGKMIICTKTRSTRSRLRKYRVPDSPKDKLEPAQSSPAANTRVTRASRKRIIQDSELEDETRENDHDEDNYDSDEEQEQNEQDQDEDFTVPENHVEMENQYHDGGLPGTLPANAAKKEPRMVLINNSKTRTGRTAMKQRARKHRKISDQLVQVDIGAASALLQGNAMQTGPSDDSEQDDNRRRKLSKNPLSKRKVSDRLVDISEYLGSSLSSVTKTRMPRHANKIQIAPKYTTTLNEDNLDDSDDNNNTNDRIINEQSPRKKGDQLIQVPLIMVQASRSVVPTSDRDVLDDETVKERTAIRSFKSTRSEDMEHEKACEEQNKFGHRLKLSIDELKKDVVHKMDVAPHTQRPSSNDVQELSLERDEAESQSKLRGQEQASELMKTSPKNNEISKNATRNLIYTTTKSPYIDTRALGINSRLSGSDVDFALEQLDLEVRQRLELLKSLEDELSYSIRNCLDLNLMKIPKRIRNMQISEFIKDFGGDVNFAVAKEAEREILRTLRKTRPKRGLGDSPSALVEETPRGRMRRAAAESALKAIRNKNLAVTTSSTHKDVTQPIQPDHLVLETPRALVRRMPPAPHVGTGASVCNVIPMSTGRRPRHGEMLISKNGSPIYLDEKKAGTRGNRRALRDTTNRQDPVYNSDDDEEEGLDQECHDGKGRGGKNRKRNNKIIESTIKMRIGSRTRVVDLMDGTCLKSLRTEKQKLQAKKQLLEMQKHMEELLSHLDA